MEELSGYRVGWFEKKTRFLCFCCPPPPPFLAGFTSGAVFFHVFLCFFEFLMVEFGRNTIFGTK